jgi:hypothetical protein
MTNAQKLLVRKYGWKKSFGYKWKNNIKKVILQK